MDDPRAWLSEVAVEEDWNDAALTSLCAKLDEWGVEIEERGEKQICIRDDRYCERVRPEPLPKLSAIRRLLDGEKKRQAQQAKQSEKAKRGGGRTKEP